MSSFHVDSRINVKLEYELAIRLGELILNAGTEDKQLLALGHKLVNMEEENQEFAPRTQESQTSGFTKWNPPQKYDMNQPQKYEAVQEATMGSMREKIRTNKIRWGIK